MCKRKLSRKMYLCAFGLPVLISIVICICNGVYPFGRNCILHIDMYHQYEPFFTEFLDKLRNGGSLMYSFRLGLGSDFMSLYAYYLASPLNWLVVLCPSSFVIEFMTVLIILKIGLCGLTFAVYIWNRFEKTDFAGILFAAFYALSGYMAAYSWNIMWLDNLVLAPLAVFGLERLVKERKCGLYCISLAAAILSNFYIAIMLCIFLVIWFVVVCLEEVKGVKAYLSAFGRFLLYSLLAGGMGSILIFPTAVILSYSGSAGISFPKTMEWYFDLISMLARHCIHVKEYTGREHWPNLYCGAAVFLFFTLYLCNRNISLKKKLTRVVLILFFWISFANNYLDFIWHGLHFPDSLPGRQAFLYVFLLVSMAYEAYQNRSGNTIVHIGLGVFVTAVFLGVAVHVVSAGMVTGLSMSFTFLLTVVYGIFLALQKLGTEKTKVLAADMLAVLAVFEVFFNFSAMGFSTLSRDGYTKNWESVQTLLEQINTEEEDKFYRTEEMERLTKNDAAIYGYRSSTIFSSLMNIGVSRFYRKVGMEGGKNFYSYSGATPLMSAMLSVKYLISQSPYEESPLRKLVAGDGRNYIYENRYALPLGFMADAGLEADWDAKKGVPVANLNRLANVLGAEKNMLAPFSGTVRADDEKTSISVKEDGYLYGTYTDTSVTNLTVTNGERVRKFTKVNHGYILDLGWCKAGDVVEITNNSGVSEFKVMVYCLNMESFQKAFETLNAQTLELDVFEDTRIEGHIDVKKAGNLLLSIPMEDGFRVYVDGREVEGKTFMESLMKIPLTAGKHRIKLSYTTPGLKEGAIVSTVCLTVFAGIFLWKRKKINKM